MIETAPGTTVAGVFTRNKCPGAPIDWCRAALAGGTARGVVINAGNANVFTGARGRETTQATAEAAAALFGCAPGEVFLSSTGVIGEILPHERITSALPGLHGQLAPDAWEAAARGIMTTDTFPKASTRTAEIDGMHRAHHRHRQGQRHDRARHGDDALLRLHRRRRVSPGAAVHADRGRRAQLQLHDGR